MLIETKSPGRTGRGEVSITSWKAAPQAEENTTDSRQQRSMHRLTPGAAHFFLRLWSHDSPSRASFFSVITGHLGHSSALSAVNSFHSSGKLSS